MRLTNEQTAAVESAVFLIGLGILFGTGWWWPGIMFVIGVSSIVLALAQGQGWYSLQGSIWTIGIGVWAMLRYNMAVFFVILGISALLNAFVKPPFLAKPYVDNSLE